VVTVLLRQMAWTGVVYGLLIIAVATLLGPHRWAVAVRTWVAGFTESTAAVVGVCFGTVLLLLWWSPGGAFDRWITALVLVALVVGAVVAVILSGRQELAAAGSPAPADPTPSDADSASTTESVS
jgi:spore maturation protein SpmB